MESGWEVLDALDDARDRSVLDHGDRMLTGAGLLDLVARAAAGLRAAGIGRGDGVALLIGRHPEALATMLAAHVVGARVLGLRPGLPDGHVRHLLAVGHAAVITDRDSVHGTAYRTRYDDLVPRTLTVAELCAGEPDGEPLHAGGRPQDVARLIHTSGSTGNPKPVAQTYAAFAAEWAWNRRTWRGATRDLATRMQRFAVFGPMTGQVVFQYTTMAFIAGGTVVMPEPGPTAEPLNRAIARLEVTATWLSVPMLTQLLAEQQNDPVELPTLRAISVGGSALAPDRHREALAALGPVVFHGYGQTEAGLISLGTPTDPPGSVGAPLDGVEVEIRDAAGAPVPTGVDGELYVRKASQASGYWQNPLLSEESFVDGWVRTRDLGRRDTEGRLELTGRARDIVIVNAATYYLGPIERVLAEHPSVAEAYVVAVPDDGTGETPHAFVVPAGEDEPDPAALRALVSDRLGADCAPSRVTVIAEPPIAPSGKPDKRLLTDVALR